MLSCMVGVSNLVSLEAGVQFSFKGNNKVNKCVIKLDRSDTYTMELWKINARKGEAVMVTDGSFLYGDMLKKFFETKTGLRLSL